MGRTSKLLLCSIPLALLAIPLGTISVAAESTSRVTIQGAGSLLFGPVTPAFHVNKLVRIPWSLIGGQPPGVPPSSTGFQETYGYHGVPVRVESGEALQVVNKSDDFHTITVVNKSDQPKTLNAALGCFFAGPCSKPPPITPTLGKVGDGNVLGLPGTPGGILNIPVTAPSGSILYFMCIFHPEMQGKIIVGQNTGEGGGAG